MRRNLMFILIIILVIVVSVLSTLAVTTISSNNIYYDNSTGLQSTNVQNAINELYGLISNSNGINVENMYFNTGESHTWSGQNQTTSSTSLTVPAGTYIVTGTNYRMTSRTSDSVIHNGPGNAKPTCSSNATVLVDGTNYIVVKGTSQMTLSVSMTTSGFNKEPLGIGVTIIAFKIG